MTNYIATKSIEYSRGRREAFRDIGMLLARLADAEQRKVKEAWTEQRKHNFRSEEYEKFSKIGSEALNCKIGYMRAILAIDAYEKEPIE